MAESILDIAARLVNDGGERNTAYDHPWVNFAKISMVWSINTGKYISPENVADMMMGLKNVRESFMAKPDNLIDMAGYARCKERFNEIDQQHRLAFDDHMYVVMQLLTKPVRVMPF
jgi:hypothetical protein